MDLLAAERAPRRDESPFDGPLGRSGGTWASRADARHEVGWYESSWELLRGLDVREEPLSADAAPFERREAGRGG